MDQINILTSTHTKLTCLTLKSCEWQQNQIRLY